MRGGELVMFEDERSCCSCYIHVEQQQQQQQQLSLKYRITNAVTSPLHSAARQRARRRRRRRPILPSFRYRRSRDINLSAAGLACRTTPRPDETN